MKPIASVEEGMQLVESFQGSAHEFQLIVPDSLQDPIGVNMALVTDQVLARGWRPNGFTQGAGYRIYLYAELE